MKPEIKQRIEQIKAGQVPNGYKKTKVGIVLEEWDIRKLKETLEKQTMKNKGNIVKNVLTNSATKGIISQTDFFDKQIANNDNTSGYYVVKNGYFVYNPRISASAPCGPFNKYYGNKDGIMSPLYTVYKYKSASECYSEFLSLYFSGSSWYSYMNGIANYGARNDRMNVSSEDMDNMPLPFPPLAEQEKIVEILSTQDKLIELQQKKIAELQKLKKIHTNKMFPQKGENVPEWRFNGFTDAWEQRKLSEIADFSKGQGYTKSDLRETGNPIILYGRLYTKYQSIIREVDTFADVISGAVLSKGGEVILPSSGETAEDIAIAASVEKSGILLGGGLNIVLPHKEIQSAFLAIEISYGTPHNELAKQAQGKSIVHLYNEDLKKVIVSYPSIEEQRKITSVFDNLDRLITLHQRKLDEMKKQKKSLMQLLLTGIVRCK